MNKKSQVSIEFMVLVGLAIVVLAVFTAITIVYMDNLYSERERVIAQRTVNSIKAEVDIAGRVSDGYTRIIELPNSINGFGYEMKFDRRYVFLSVLREGGEEEFVAGLSTDIRNTNPPNNLVGIEVTPAGGEVEMVVEKKSGEVYVCSFEDFLDNGDTCPNNP